MKKQDRSPLKTVQRQQLVRKGRGWIRASLSCIVHSRREAASPGECIRQDSKQRLDSRYLSCAQTAALRGELCSA